MSEKIWQLYLSGEIHTNWRDEIKALCVQKQLPVITNSPNTIHEDSDDCGVNILGAEADKFWHDHKGASINSIRNSTLIKNTDILIVKFGDKYRQWNAAFDTGIAKALNKPIITLHDDNLNHALKEINQSAAASCRSVNQVVKILSYIIKGELK
jgi:YtoQ family protein|tara:strand:- start:6427 stop:6888 length:462 start_codon:yes stop_codon:yes gene_type:complete